MAGADIGRFFSHLFGGATAETTADMSVSAIASVINDAVQNCGQSLTNEEFNNITVGRGAVVQGITLNVDQTIALKEGCLQSEEATNQVDQALQASAAQVSKAIAQQFGLSTAKSKDVIRLNAQVASTIKNNFVQNCSNQDFNLIANNVSIGEDATVGSIILNSDQYIQAQIECVAKGDAITNIKSDLTATITQEAAATVENFFTPFFIALAVIIGIIALFLFLPALFRGRGPAPTGDTGLQSLLLEAGEAPGPPKGPVPEGPSQTLFPPKSLLTRTVAEA